MTTQKTTLPSVRKEQAQRRWWLIDATGVPLGRIASKAATLLMGKHKPNYVPFWDIGDGVIIINASRATLTGKKLETKMFRRHSGYPGGLKEVPFGTMLQTDPDALYRKVVWGMLPKNRLGKKMLRRLRVFQGSDHDHKEQNPIPLDLKGGKR
ncbi:MAG: 50S ribosomal protein L13 [bacterium JZ-2024 1]